MLEEIQRVACIGSGLVGQGWAAQFAVNGYEVIMQDLSEEKLDTAKERVIHHIGILIEAGLANSGFDESVARLTATTGLSEALNKADFVIESVFESLDVKCPLYAEMDELAPKRVVFASSTSGFMMTDITRDMKNHPERAIVAHPWNPVHLIPLVELSPGKKTSKRQSTSPIDSWKTFTKSPLYSKKRFQDS